MIAAGYSGTPLWKKLGFKPGMKVAVLNGPGHYGALLPGRPEGISFTASAKGSDAIHLFMTEAKEIGKVAELARHLPPAAISQKCHCRACPGNPFCHMREASVPGGMGRRNKSGDDRPWGIRAL